MKRSIRLRLIFSLGTTVLNVCIEPGCLSMGIFTPYHPKEPAAFILVSISIKVNYRASRLESAESLTG